MCRADKANEELCVRRFKLTQKRSRGKKGRLSERGGDEIDERVERGIIKREGEKVVGRGSASVFELNSGEVDGGRGWSSMGMGRGRGERRVVRKRGRERKLFIERAVFMGTGCIKASVA